MLQINEDTLLKFVFTNLFYVGHENLKPFRPRLPEYHLNLIKFTSSETVSDVSVKGYVTQQSVVHGLVTARHELFKGLRTLLT